MVHTGSPLGSTELVADEQECSEKMGKDEG